MLLSMSKIRTSDVSSSAHRTGWLRPCLPRLPSRLTLANSWEIYVILLITGFLHFYQVDASEFDDDQAVLFRMAYDAVHHGLLPITSNTASISIAHPPGVIYLFMLPAALSANPLWAIVFIGIFNIVAVLLTYLFTRRYHGRLAGAVAALLYATALRPLLYGRFIWQPNLMPPFVVLFMFTLFWGVVERRKGWLFPALLLLGILYQMHETALLLLVPLLLAVVFAPGTMRWRDLGLAFVALLLLFSPYLLWEFSTRFADLLTLYLQEKQHGRLYLEGINYYQLFLSPYDRLPTNMHSVVRMLAPAIAWLNIVVPLLALCGFVTAGVLSMWGKMRLHNWWTALRATPYRCGLLLLLIWQIAPLALLLVHKIGLTWHYFLILMPGPFVLMGFFVSKLTAWLHLVSDWHGQKWHVVRYGIYVLIGLVIVAQAVNCTAAIIDTGSGNFSDRDFPPYPYHNDLRSLQHAVSEADQLAQQRHLNKVYITTDAATQTALRYLAEQMHAPTTLFDASHCLVLPNPAAGPAVLLVGPYDDLTNTLLSQFARATLIDQPTRLGGPPFRLYVVTPAMEPPLSHTGFVQNLQLLAGQAQNLRVNDSSLLVTRWSLLRSEQPRFRTTYSYAMTALLDGNSGQSRQNLCTFTSLQEGDELLAAFDLPIGASVPASITIKAQFFMTIPNNPIYGPLHTETNDSLSIQEMTLRTADGRDGVTVASRLNR